MVDTVPSRRRWYSRLGRTEDTYRVYVQVLSDEVKFHTEIPNFFGGYVSYMFMLDEVTIKGNALFTI